MSRSSGQDVVKGCLSTSLMHKIRYVRGREKLPTRGSGTIKSIDFLVCQTRDTTNEALRALYVASRDRAGFPVVMPAGCEDEDGNVSICAILQGLGLISGKEQEGCYDGYESRCGRSGGVGASMPNAPASKTPALVRSIAITDTPRSFGPATGSTYVHVVESNMTSPIAASNEYRDSLNQAEQIHQDAEEMHDMDESSPRATTR